MDGDAGKGCLGRWLNDSSIFGGVEGRAVAGTDEQVLAGIVVNGAASVRAGGIVGHELAAVEMHKDAGIII